MTNYLLAWYLEEETGFHCDPEKFGSQDRRFDVEVYETSKEEKRVSNIFIKRIATSNNMRTSMDEFEDKKSELPNCSANICLHLVFSANEDTDRLRGLLERYGYMSARIENSCFSDEDVLMSVTPAVADADRASFTALSEIKNHIENYFEITLKN